MAEVITLDQPEHYRNNTLNHFVDQPVMYPGRLVNEIPERGEIVEFVHRSEFPGRAPSERVEPVIVLGEEDKRIAVVSLATYSFGRGHKTHKTDQGLIPYDTGSGPQWNGIRYTRRTGQSVSTEMTEDQAERLANLFSNIEAAQAAHGVEATEPTPILTALEGLIEFTKSGHKYLR